MDDIQINISNNSQNEELKNLAERKRKFVEKKDAKKLKNKTNLKPKKDKTEPTPQLQSLEPKELQQQSLPPTPSKPPTIDNKTIKKPFTPKNTNNVNNNKHKPSTKQETAAKFSSLFKNNHEIPNIGDINVSAEDKKRDKEELFSKNAFATLNLSDHLKDCLEKRFNLAAMTSIQEKAIPAILDQKDCFVRSQTGSGKTLAYAIPIVQRLLSREPKLKRSDGIRAVVLVPTRELALQTCQVFEKLCNACIWIVTGALIGGMKKKAEKDRIRRGLNILIATPGRLCDHLDTTIALDLSKVEFLVFDEADRMLDMDFEKKINFIIFKIHSARKKALEEPDIPKYCLDENGEPIEDPNQSQKNAWKRLDPQTILTSATFTSGIKEIGRRLNLTDALHIDSNYTNDKSDSQTLNGLNVEDGEVPKEETKEEKKKRKYEEEKKELEIEKVSLPAGLQHYYMSVPSKLRLIGLLSFILDKFKVNKTFKFISKTTNYLNILLSSIKRIRKQQN
jgi:superfamily II DNA/RNA helicase